MISFHQHANGLPALARQVDFHDALILVMYEMAHQVGEKHTGHQTSC